MRTLSEVTASRRLYGGSAPVAYPSRAAMLRRVNELIAELNCLMAQIELLDSVKKPNA